MAGKAADNSKLTSLLEKRAEIELRLAELGKQINDAKAELRGKVCELAGRN